MNASVRNPVFFPSFFLTPLILGLTAFIAANQSRKRSALLFAASAAIYVVGAFLVTAMINVPVNEALVLVGVPTHNQVASETWQAYSTRWQFWNTLRTLVSGLSLLLTGLAIYSLNQEVT